MSPCFPWWGAVSSEGLPRHDQSTTAAKHGGCARQIIPTPVSLCLASRGGRDPSATSLHRTLGHTLEWFLEINNERSDYGMADSS